MSTDITPSLHPIYRPTNRQPIPIHTIHQTSQRSRTLHYQKIINFIKDQGGTPDEMRRRSVLIAAEWGKKTATALSLYNNWTRFDAAIGQVSDADVETFTEAQDRVAMLERLADE